MDPDVARFISSISSTRGPATSQAASLLKHLSASRSIRSWHLAQIVQGDDRHRSRPAARSRQGTSAQPDTNPSRGIDDKGKNETAHRDVASDRLGKN
jgi:hypothetical protein